MSGFRRSRLIGLGVAALLTIASAAWAQHDALGEILLSDHPAIDYPNAPTTDPGELLNRKLASGKLKLEYGNDGRGYLASLLSALDVNPDSQTLVFSKTSFQATRISPRTPRALYYNDHVSVGYVQGSDMLELAALDPKQGYIFYTLDNTKAAHPSLDRRDVCLQCHHGPATAGVPGIMVASVYADSSGMPYARLGMPATDHRTRFDQRWGGWYVTGTHGGMYHRGNAVARDRTAPDVLEIRDAQNITDLSKKFDVAPYLQKTSDIVALLTLEHQTRMTNLLTRLGWKARIAEAEHRPADIDGEIDTTVAYMLFADEAPLVDKVVGVSTFQQTFPERGPRDSQGRSLRDFDLNRRLFRYPLSYMIYSEVFDSLPAPVRERLYRRLFDVLTGRDSSPQFAKAMTAKLAPETRKAILEILCETKPDANAWAQ
jgi:hypothetical protein